MAVVSCKKKENPFDPEANVDFSPKNITVQILSPYVLKLNWEIPNTIMDGIKIDRKEDNGEWINNIAPNLGNNSTSWTDYYCKPNTNYAYRLYAIAGNNVSDYTTVIKKTPEGNPNGTFTDARDGKTYKWVQIGSQMWMSENLAYIPYVCMPSDSGGIWVLDYYGQNVSEAILTQEYQSFGCLYNWEMANSIAPEGWHLPTKEEWNLLFNYVGGINIAASKLMAAGNYYWSYNTSLNESGFTALPGGDKLTPNFGNSFQGGSALFWAAIPTWAVELGWDLEDYMNFSNQGDCCFITGSNDDIYVTKCYFARGGSVRCIKN